MTKQLQGFLVPAVSTFTSNGDIDASAFTSNIRSWLSQGVDGILLAGSSGESALLDDSDRRVLIASAREAVPADKWLLAGIGSESTRQTISRARDAAELGADAVLVVSPHYYLKRMTENALLAHFMAVADASPLPVLLYNIPVYAHVVLSPGLVAELSQHPNVVGMKDSAGNLPMLEEYLRSQGDNFHVLTGSGVSFVRALEMGARGAILAIGLYATAMVRAAFDAFAEGNLAEAQALQGTLAPLATNIAAAYGPAGIKAALDHIGLHGAQTRSPLLPLTTAELEQVRSLLDASLLKSEAV